MENGKPGALMLVLSFTERIIKFINKPKLKYLQPILCFKMGVKYLTSGSNAGMKVQSSF